MAVDLMGELRASPASHETCGTPDSPRVFAQVHDLERARVLGERLYYPHRLTPLVRAEEFTFSARAACLGTVTIGLLRYSSAMRIDTEPYETSYQVNVPLMGMLRTAVGAEHVEATNTRAALYGPDVPTAISGWDRPSVMLAIKLDRWHVEEAFRRESGGSGSAPRLATALDVTRGAGRAWIAAARAVVGTVQRVPDLDTDLARYFADRCIDGFVRAVIDREPVPEVAISAEADLVHRAIEAITHTSGPPLSLGTIAACVGVSGRTLQSAFRHVLEKTPMQVQREDRLRRVRRDLLSATPGQTSVGAVALRHGFTHLGRFSAQYRAEFGELPSETLIR